MSRQVRPHEAQEPSWGHCQGGTLTMLMHPKARSSWLGLRPWMEELPKAYSRAATFDTCHAKSLCIAQLNGQSPTHGHFVRRAAQVFDEMQLSIATGV